MLFDNVIDDMKNVFKLLFFLLKDQAQRTALEKLIDMSLNGEFIMIIVRILAFCPLDNLQPCVERIPPFQ